MSHIKIIYSKFSEIFCLGLTKSGCEARFQIMLVSSLNFLLWVFGAIVFMVYFICSRQAYNRIFGSEKSKKTCGEKITPGLILCSKCHHQICPEYPHRIHFFNIAIPYQMCPPSYEIYRENQRT